LGVIIYDPNAIPGEQVKFQGLAFDPYRKLPNILPTVNATGDFVWSFESSYPDQRGVSVPWLPKGAVAMPQSSSPGVEAGVTVAGNTVRVETQDASDTPIDVAFILLIWWPVMYRITLNDNFEIVDLRPGKPDAASGRQFEISEVEFVRLKKVGDLNTANGLPRFMWDPKSGTAIEVPRKRGTVKWGFQ
jgi:hypothetical protein